MYNKASYFSLNNPDQKNSLFFKKQSVNIYDPKKISPNKIKCNKTIRKGKILTTYEQFNETLKKYCKEICQILFVTKIYYILFIIK